MRRVLLLAAIFTFVLASSTMAVDISGKWTITWWGAGAEESFPLDIKAAGENLTITGDHPGFGEMTGAGTLKGNSVSMTLVSSSMEIALTGKIAGNKMEGAREIKSSGDGRGGGAPEGEAPQGGMPPGGGMPGSTGGPGGEQAGAPQGGPGADAAGGNENWTAVKN